MTRFPKILIVGQWMWPWYQEACATALEKIGCKVERFSWFDEFYRWQNTRTEPVYKSIRVALQNRLLNGPALWRLNHRLLQTTRPSCPDVIWFYDSVYLSGYYPTSAEIVPRNDARPVNQRQSFWGSWETVRNMLPFPENMVTCVDRNSEDERAYSVLWLMTQCRHFIIANSSFSCWGRG